MKTCKPVYLIILLILVFTSEFTVLPQGFSDTKPDIIDYQKYLNKKFKKIRRKTTTYIIVHTSEAGKISTLRTLSGGKKIGKRRTNGGHANYCVLRDGKIYRTLDHPYRADHTGLSMWNGAENLSSHSIGIELVGYHYGTITFEQYRSLTPLLNELQEIYNIPDRNVLTHSQVSYGRPNLWFKKNHRGRKRCALNFNRVRAGLGDRWAFDPDVRAGRLTSDHQITRVFYSAYSENMVKVPPEKTESMTVSEQISEFRRTELVLSSNVISIENTAWNIAGEDYNDPETLYALPDGKKLRGNEVGKSLGWGNLPEGTKVFLNQPEFADDPDEVIHTIRGNFTAWSFAGKNYKKDTTFYFYPNGNIKDGSRVNDWDSLPSGVKMIIGYDRPSVIGSKPGETAWGIAGKYYNKRETVYFIPGRGVLTGDKMTLFNNLPRNSKIFLKRR